MQLSTTLVFVVAGVAILACGASDPPRDADHSPLPAPELPALTPATEPPPPAAAVSDAARRPVRPSDVRTVQVGAGGECPFPAPSCPPGCVPWMGDRRDEARQCVAAVVVGCDSWNGVHNSMYSCLQHPDGITVNGPSDLLGKLGPEWRGCRDGAPNDAMIRRCTAEAAQ